jgi:hypothetical protein
MESSSVECRVCRSFGQVEQFRRSTNAALLRVHDRQVQGHDRLRMVYFMPTDHVLGCSECDIDCDMRGLSGELHVAARERVEGLLPVQRGLYT